MDLDNFDRCKGEEISRCAAALISVRSRSDVKVKLAKAEKRREEGGEER